MEIGIYGLICLNFRLFAAFLLIFMSRNVVFALFLKPTFYTDLLFVGSAWSLPYDAVNGFIGLFTSFLLYFILMLSRILLSLTLDSKTNDFYSVSAEVFRLYLSS